MDVASLFRRYQPKRHSFLCMDDLPLQSHCNRSCGERADGSAFSRSMGKTSTCLVGFVHMGKTAECSVPAADYAAGAFSATVACPDRRPDGLKPCGCCVYLGARCVLRIAPGKDCKMTGHADSKYISLTFLTVDVVEVKP